jgi:hypothetical protein
VFSSYKEGEGPTGGSIMGAKPQGTGAAGAFFGRQLPLYRQLPTSSSCPTASRISTAESVRWGPFAEPSGVVGGKKRPVYLPRGDRVLKIINKAGNEQPFSFFLLVPLRCQLRRSTANLDYPVFADAVLELRRELVAVFPCANFTI